MQYNMILFKDRILNIAVLTSALWHFVFMFSIKPVFLSGHVIEHKTSISFLGDILEKISPNNEKPFTIGRISLENKMDKVEPIESDFISIQPEKKDFLYSPRDRSFLELSMSCKKEASKIDFSDFFIRGDARDRVIIYKPDLDKITTLPSDFNSDFSVSIKFKISKYGFVKYAETIISSGFSEIDQAAMRHVKKWQFAPDSKDDQEGVVRVNFK